MSSTTSNENTSGISTSNENTGGAEKVDKPLHEYATPFPSAPSPTNTPTPQTPLKLTSRHLYRSREHALDPARKAPLPPLPLLPPPLLQQIQLLRLLQNLRPPRLRRPPLRALRRLALLQIPALPGAGKRHRPPPRPILPFRTIRDQETIR